MATIVISGVDVYLVYAVCLEEVVEELGPLAVAHHHPEVPHPVPVLDAVCCSHQPPLTHQAGPTEGGGSDQPSQVGQPSHNTSLGLLTNKTNMPRVFTLHGH